MISLTRFLERNLIRTTMFVVIIRSICAGVAAVFLACGLCIFVGLPIASYFLSGSAPPGPGDGMDVGWDLVTMAHNSPASAVLIPLLIFAIGFFLGFRYFSRSLAKN